MIVAIGRLPQLAGLHSEMACTMVVYVLGKLQLASTDGRADYGSLVRSIRGAMCTCHIGGSDVLLR